MVEKEDAWPRGRMLPIPATDCNGDTMKPLAAIRQFCLACQGSSRKAAQACADNACALWCLRAAPEDLREASGERQALRAIRRQCLDCAGGRAEVRACAAKDACILWSYRFGVLPRTYKAVRKRFFAPRHLRLPA